MRYIDVPLQSFHLRHTRVPIPAQKITKHRVIGQGQVDLAGGFPDLADERLVHFSRFVVIKREAEGYKLDRRRVFRFCKAHYIEDRHLAPHDLRIAAVAGQSDFHHSSVFSVSVVVIVSAGVLFSASSAMDGRFCIRISCNFRVYTRCV